MTQSLCGALAGKVRGLISAFSPGSSASFLPSISQCDTGKKNPIFKYYML